MILSRVLCCFCALLVPVLGDHWWWRVGRCHYEEVVFKSAASPWCPQFLFSSYMGLTTNYVFVTFLIVNNKNFHLEMSIFDCIEDFTKLNKKIQQRKELYCISGFKLFNSCNQTFSLKMFAALILFPLSQWFRHPLKWNEQEKSGLGAAIWSSSKIFLQFEFATDKSGEFCKGASEGENFPGFNFLARAGSHL